MFTVIPLPEIIDHRNRQPVPGEPTPTIIDHRREKENNGRVFTGERKRDTAIDSVKTHRDELLLSEIKYKRRIQELEKENEELVKVYEPTYKENKQLKGLILHGPDAQKIKKLNEEKKQLKGELEITKEESAELAGRVQELERAFVSEKDYYLEKKWREATEKGKRRREEREAGIAIQGPFTNAKKRANRDLRTVKDEEFERQDEYDLHIDSLEKETQILLNKIKQIRQNKENIDYAYFVGKGAVTRNVAISNAINEKLDRDLKAFAERLETLTKKANTIKVETHVHPIQVESSGTSVDKSKTTKKSKTKFTCSKYFRSRKTQTDVLIEEKQIRANNGSAKEIRAHACTPVKKTPKTPDKSTTPYGRNMSSATSGNKAVSSPAKDYRNVNEHVPSHTNFTKAKPAHNNEDTRRDLLTHLITNNQNETQIKNPNDTIQIEDHWGQLASKLNETEKYRHSREIRSGLTQKDANDKVVKYGKRNGSHRSGDSKLKGEVSTPLTSSEPKRQIKFLKEQSPISKTHESVPAKTAKSKVAELWKRSPMNSGKSQRNVLSGGKSPLAMEEIYANKFQTDTNQKRDSGDTKFTAKNATAWKGEIIRYIPKQHSWDTGYRVTQVVDETGRYSNGPEPIRQKIISVQDVPSPEKITSKIKHQTRDVSTNNQSVASDTRQTRYIKSKVNQTPPEGESRNTKNTSAYDTVLAEARQQYKEHNLKIVTQEVQAQTDRERTRQTETNIYSPQKPDSLSERIEYKSDGRKVGDGQFNRIVGNSGLRSGKWYSQQLLYTNDVLG